MSDGFSWAVPISALLAIAFIALIFYLATRPK